VEHLKQYAIALAISVSAAIFVCDILTPVGDALWILYTIPLLVVSSRPQRALPFLITGASWVLIVLGYYFSPKGGDPTTDLLNRISGMAVQLALAIVLVQRNRKGDELKKRRVELEQEVIERRAMEDELRRYHETLLVTLAKEKELENSLRQSQKMESLGTLAGGIAHDFNNILAAMIGFTELARDKAPVGSPVHRHLDKVFSAGVRGRDLVRRILTFSRQSEPDRQLLRISSVIEETVKLLQATLPSTMSILTNTEGESGFILADPTQMGQMVMNLCTNAAHAMKQTGGSISISVSDLTFTSPEQAPEPSMNPGTYVVLSVIDTGEGMTPELRERIFDPFFTSKAKGEGTGLGLSVVHGIVTSHGGAITVLSEPGSGSTFTVYLPKHQEDRVRVPEDGDDPIAGGHERILLVDDEEAVAEVGSEILADLGYSVVSKTNSREALALFRLDPSRFDLIVTDMTMPELTGIRFAREVLALRPGTPVILTTGFSHVVDPDAAREAGIRAFVMKPLTKREIAKTIRKVLDELVE
jgi:signal transduction histidine kinase/ActR/RegA family two-component response regulator